MKLDIDSKQSKKEIKTKISKFIRSILEAEKQINMPETLSYP